MNRLDRDTILIRALDLVDSPSLDAKDRPSGTIVAGALSIGWLQDGLDYFIHHWPIGATIKTTAITILKDTETLATPTDFILDYQDGILLDSDEGRLGRRGLNAILNVVKDQKSRPRIYTITGTTLFFRPVPDKNYGATLYYYALPAVLGATDKPAFPSDLILVKYVWLRGLEWINKVPPTAAETFAQSIISQLQKAGIGVEAESDQIPVGRGAFPGSGIADRNAWMGDPVGGS